MRKHGSRSASAVAEQPLVSVSDPAPVPAALVVVDYPREKEAVTSFEYTIRIGAGSEAERVEISIDGGEWQPCRPAVGYWWYDWSGYAPKASRQVAARLITRGGETVYSLPRRFSVRLPKPAAAPKAAAKTPRTRKKTA